MIELKNEYIQAKIVSKGAELVSFFDLKRDKELLWQADGRHWAKHAPILFPIVGSLKEGQYCYDNIMYKLPRHGFARDQTFIITSFSEDQVTLELTDHPELMPQYPFRFKLIIAYQLCEDKLLVNYSVENTSHKEMFFSIGAHPAFNCDLLSESHFLKIEMKEKLEELECLKIDLESGLILKENKIIELEDGKLRLTPQLFNEDALIFKGENINGFVLNLGKEGDILKFECENYPYIGIWSPKAPFVCIEPWYGISDFEDTTQKLQEKHGIIQLEGNSKFECKYSMALAK